MLKNYFKIAWRNILRNKVNSFINIAGLATAIACVILIVMYIQDELSYDKFLKDSDHIFQLNMTTMDNGVPATTGGNTAPAVGPIMVSLFPEVEACARIYRPGDVLVRYEEGEKQVNYFTEKRLLAVDSNFLQVFAYPLLQGDPSTCLERPNSIVITEKTAKKYFGTSNAVGKVLLFDTDKKPFTVAAVLKDIPSQSTFQFDILAPIVAYGEVKKRSWNWFWLQTNTYIKLRGNVATDKASVATLEAKFPGMVKEHLFKATGQSFEEFIKKGGKLEYSLMPFTSVHLHASPMNVPARLTTLSDVKYIYIFSAIAVFIIILACVNFMNLSTAQSAKRSKEVGIRKVLGSLRTQLIKQFLAEAILYSLIATVIALILVALSLPSFNEIAGKTLTISAIFSGNIWLFIIGLCLLTGLLAGLYPAFYLTSFNPVAVLKGMKLFKNNIGNLFIRNGLVVFQFTVSITLIICTLVVFKQLKYTQEKDMGLNKENVVVIANGKRLGSKEETFRQELMKMPGVIDATISSSIPTKVSFEDGYVPEGTEADKPLVENIGLSSFMVDEEFVSTLKMHVLQGRNFSKEFSDSASVILNETAAKMIGWKEPVGKYLAYPGNDQRFKVIAVVKDFNVSSLRETIEPFALFHLSSKTYGPNNPYISVRLRAGNMNKYLGELETKWKSFAPNTPFDYNFLDTAFDALYRSERRMGAVFGIFTFLSIFVACLGLFGLSVYTAERRTKEIGVRKVLGASVQSVVTLLSKDFLKLVLISTVIAFPVAWFAMNKWLEDFVYRTSIGWIVFVISGFAALLIALLTISFQAIKAAVANPVKSLRTE
ncbi:MAG: ABC transporter permease [Bacteroidota bacterium]